MYRKMCILCQQTSPKRWFGDRIMTSFCDITNSAHQIQMTTLCRWMKPPAWKVSAYATAHNSWDLPRFIKDFETSGRQFMETEPTAIRIFVFIFYWFSYNVAFIKLFYFRNSCHFEVWGGSIIILSL